MMYGITFVGPTDYASAITVRGRKKRADGFWSYHKGLGAMPSATMDEPMVYRPMRHPHFVLASRSAGLGAYTWPSPMAELLTGSSPEDLVRLARERDAELMYKVMVYPWLLLRDDSDWWVLALSIPVAAVTRGLTESQVKELLWILYRQRDVIGIDHQIKALIGLPYDPEQAKLAWHAMGGSDDRVRLNDMAQQVGAYIAQQSYDTYTPEQLAQHRQDLKAHIELTGGLPEGADLIIGPTVASGKQAWQIFEAKKKKPTGIIEQLTMLALVIGGLFISYQVVK